MWKGLSLKSSLEPPLSFFSPSICIPTYLGRGHRRTLRSPSQHGVGVNTLVTGLFVRLILAKPGQDLLFIESIEAQRDVACGQGWTSIPKSLNFHWFQETRKKVLFVTCFLSVSNIVGR